ncbi:MAG: hypothetical protein E6J70_09965 [Deltaproteobacteria bacterium]|nr:MAG: hypothetical protein E6J70_09965 [Deltaproteobacteria bacterium]
MRRLAALVTLLATLAPARGSAVQLDALDLARPWRLRALRFRGPSLLRQNDLRKVMTTKPRPWFAVWRARPLFDPAAFRADLDRLRRLYRSRGYYDVRVTHDLELPRAGDALVAVIFIEEGKPVTVAAVDVTLAGTELPVSERRLLLDHLPIARGRPFTEEAYSRADTYLGAYYREHGFARVEVTRQAVVDLERHEARVAYRLESGPPCVFGETRITGTKTVDPAVPRRELAYAPGEPFKQSLLDRTRRDLLALNLFRAVRIEEDKSGDPEVAVRIHLTEAPPREVRLGVGYDTEEQIRGLASWRHYDFLGGARQLGFTGRASFIHRTVAADFLQPHFPGHRNRTRLLLAEQEEEEDTFTLDRSRLSPRLEWEATDRITGYAFYRIEYDLLSSVDEGVKRALPRGAPGTGVLSGLGFGADWNTTDDLVDPSRGWVLGATVEPVGGVLGGDFNFVRLVADGRFYLPLVGGLLGATRFRLGTAEAYTRHDEVPLFERFYAGGIDSVRGYGRRRIGPRAKRKDFFGRVISTTPIGGRTLAEASVELRHPITEKLGAAVFLDGGQVNLQSFDFPIDSLRYGAGFGVRYRSPVGPLRVDLGFPFQPPDGDQRWQVHVSLGSKF